MLAARAVIVPVSISAMAHCHAGCIGRKRLDLQGRLPLEKLPGVFGKIRLPLEHVIEKQIPFFKTDPETKGSS